MRQPTRRSALGLVLVLLLGLTGTVAAQAPGLAGQPAGEPPPEAAGIPPVSSLSSEWRTDPGASLGVEPAESDLQPVDPLSSELGRGRGASLPVEPEQPETDDPPVGAVEEPSVASPGVEPQAVSAGPLAPGESAEFEKTVQTPSIPPKPDVYFLVDSTGSMGPAISNVQTNAASILTQVSAVQPDAHFGAGDYRDFPLATSEYAFRNDAPIGAQGPALEAIGAWTALVGGGGDGSEAQLYALDQIAADAADWRTDSSRIVVWFGDWPGHDPVCAAISGLDYDITEASATDKLIAAGIRVIAISVSTTYSFFDPDCTLCDLDGNPELSPSDYSGICPINGSAGQATRIAAATGGVLFSKVPPEAVSARILEGLQNLPATVTPQLDPACSTELDYAFSPVSQTVTSGEAASFVETVTVKPEATSGLRTCTVHWLINAVPAGPDFEQSISIEVRANQPPIADADGPYSGDEGSPIRLDGTGSSDPDGDPLSYAWSMDSPLCSFDDGASATPDLTCTDDGDFTVTLEVSDGEATDSDTAAVTVYNVSPSVRIDSVAPVLLAVGESVTAEGSFTDPGTNDTHTAQWDWGDGSSSTGTVSGQKVGPDSHIYTTAGIYTVQLTVTDDDGGVGTDAFAYVIVYDSGAGFVTGGGWIDSPPGAYSPDKRATGKANFGFVAKYKKGRSTPEGDTEFHVRVGGLNFHGSSYKWLVITGKNYARFKGVGTLNGKGAYPFMVWAGDGTGAGGADTFRIKIWKEDASGETTIYDNGMDQVISGGSIVIHTQGK